MGLITKTVKVEITNNAKYYESLGYKIPRQKNVNYQMVVPKGTKIEVRVEDLPLKSNTIVEYECDICHNIHPCRYSDYTKCVKDDGIYYCSFCTKTFRNGENMRLTKLKKGKSLEQWCEENNRYDILLSWDYELNEFTPDEIGFKTNRYIWLKCLYHPEHESRKVFVTSITNGNNILCYQCNSIAQWFIDNHLDINDYWDFEKNTVDPWEISYGSKTKCWFKCQEKDYHGSYEVPCVNFTIGKQRCPYCYTKKVHPRDSLGRYIVDNYGEEFLNKIWSSKNKKSSFEYAQNSHNKVWWKCSDEEHEDYLRSCKASVNYEFRCPKCSEEMNNSIIEEKTKTYLKELGYKVLTEHECTIRPINPKTKRYLPYDNEIVLKNGKHLIIEVHGYQHYNIHFYITRHKCTECEAKEKLHYQQVKDRYKRIKCKQAGYEYLEIPNYAFIGKNRNLYKELIDNKIEEILNIDKAS